jgi:hypothetical protein
MVLFTEINAYEILVLHNCLFNITESFLAQAPKYQLPRHQLVTTLQPLAGLNATELFHLLESRNLHLTYVMYSTYSILYRLNRRQDRLRAILHFLLIALLITMLKLSQINISIF